jgi:hypothetical protein
LRAILDRAGQSRLVTADEVATVVVQLCIAPTGSRTGEAIVVEGSSR